MFVDVLVVLVVLPFWCSSSVVFLTGSEKRAEFSLVCPDLAALRKAVTDVAWPICLTRFIFIFTSTAHTHSDTVDSNHRTCRVGDSALSVWSVWSSIIDIDAMGMMKDLYYHLVSMSVSLLYEVGNTYRLPSTLLI